MAELVQQNLVLLIIALLIGIAVAWYIFARGRKTTVIERSTESEPAGAAKRNQALIDAPPAAASADPLPPPTPDALGGVSVAVAKAVAESPAEEAATSPAQANVTAGSADDLTRIKGVGPKLAALLGELGVTSFAQIAAWDDAEIDRIDAKLGRFEGRIRRDSWVEQAGYLAAGDTAAYQAKFGNI